MAQTIEHEKIERIVDMGCGTGLSTFFWTDIAKEIIGIEPNKEMLNTAINESKVLGVSNVKFIQGISSNTGLEDNSVDLLLCSQALHWMEPLGTFQEVARILKPGGVFAAFDCNWPPTVKNWEAEEAYIKFQKNTKAEGIKRSLFQDVKKWKKGEHLQRMKDCGHFSYVKEIVVHHQEEGNAERLINLALSQGGVSTVLKSGISQEELGIPHLREVAIKVLGNELTPWYWSYKVRVAIKGKN